VNPDFETERPDRPQHRFIALSDQRSGQQRAVEQRPHAVQLHHVGAADLAEKTGSKHAPDGFARVVGPQAEEKTRRRVERPQQFRQIGHADPRAAVGIDIDLEGEEGGHANEGVFANPAYASSSPAWARW
jgi:hypothetical protein